MARISGKANLEHDLSDLRMEGISFIRGMKKAFNAGDIETFHCYYARYKGSERDYFVLIEEMFPENIDQKYREIMLQYHKF